MTYKGHVKDGVIVFDEDVALEEGTAVVVEIAKPPACPNSEVARARMEHYRHLIGAIKDAPADWSENHDAYLREEHLR